MELFKSLKAKIIIALIAVLLIGIAIPKLTVHDLVPVDTLLKQCANITSNLHYDNPIEKVALFFGKSRIIAATPTSAEIESFTLFRIPLGILRGQPGMKTIIFCNPAGDWSATNVIAIVAKKQAMAGNTIIPGADEVPPPPTLGIQDPIDQTILGQGLVLGTNTWKGYVDGKLTTVTGTAEANNPSQGVLFVWEPGQTESNIESSRTYLALTATGPLKIVSEANGILTLQSVAGTYEAYDLNTNTRHNVTAKGGTMYTFDIRSRTFK